MGIIDGTLSGILNFLIYFENGNVILPKLYVMK